MLGGMAMQKDIGALLTLAGCKNLDRDSASEAAITQGDVDRLPAGGGDASAQQFESMVLEVLVEGQIDIGQTLSLSLNLQHAPLNAAGTGAGTYANVPAASLPATAAVSIAGTGAAFQQALRYDVRLTELKRFIRAVLTPDFSAAGGAAATNFANIAIVSCLGGAHNVVTRTLDWTPAYAS